VGESAAVLLGLPIVGRLAQAVHLAATESIPPASTASVRWFRGRLRADEIVRVNGVRVTGVARTAVDLARTRPFPTAVAAVDAALKRSALPAAWAVVGGQVRPAATAVLPGASRDDLRCLLGDGGRGIRIARAAVEFGDPDAANAGESISRSRIHLLGFPAPLLQRRFVDPDGTVAIVDFDWPDFGVSGEFDGFVKFSRQEYLRGSLPAEALWREKERERRLRRHHRRDVARWTWDDLAGRANGLRDELVAAGLPTTRR